MAKKPATKIIKTTITLQGRDADGVFGNRAPGTPVKLDAGEADGLLLRFGGTEVRSDEGANDDGGDGLEKHTVAELKEIAARENVDLADVTLKDDIIAAIRLGREEV